MTQLDRGQLKAMTPEEIVAAHDAGNLNDLLGIPPEVTAAQRLASDPTARLTRADVRLLHRLGFNDAISLANAEDRIDLDSPATAADPKDD